MNRRTWAAAAAVTFCVVLACVVGSRLAAVGESKPAQAKDGKKDPAKDFFGLTRAHKIHLSLSAKEWAKMQPAAPRFPWMPAPATKGNDKKAADTHKGGFGMEFPWTRGELTVLGKTFKNVGLRFKGNFTYMASS